MYTCAYGLVLHFFVSQAAGLSSALKCDSGGTEQRVPEPSARVQEGRGAGAPADEGAGYAEASVSHLNKCLLDEPGLASFCL